MSYEDRSSDDPSFGWTFNHQAFQALLGFVSMVVGALVIDSPGTVAICVGAFVVFASGVDQICRTIKETRRS